MKNHKQKVRKHKHFHSRTDPAGKMGLVGQRVSHMLFDFSVSKVAGSWAQDQPSCAGPTHTALGQPVHSSH